MNQHLTKAAEAAAKADALMYAIETCYMDPDVDAPDPERTRREEATFYALWDAIRSAQTEIERLEGDSKTVDAIYAANAVRTLKTDQ